ncbi:uncharacterized protein [Anas acuta]|uniref:uncharacterized protein n=1 Tax=Anas acuta TaxID=28680 RepID=UPI0035C8C1E2
MGFLKIVEICLWHMERIVPGWLKPYGYLLPCDSQMSTLQAGKAVQSAVATMQQFYGIPVTGVLDQTTLDCGPDEDLEKEVAGCWTSQSESKSLCCQAPSLSSTGQSWAKSPGRTLSPGLVGVFLMASEGRSSRELHQPSAQFHLEDPYCRLLRTEYNCLHDPHLQAYYSRKDSLQSLKSKGFITSSGKVVCSLKEFNEYRQYLTTLKLEAEKIRRQEEEKLQQQFAKLKKLDARLMAGSDRSRQSSSNNVYLVTKEKASLLQPQKPAGPPTHKSRRNFLHSGQHRRLKVTPSSVEVGREDAKLPGSVHPVRESERESPIPADGVFKAASEDQAARESQKIEEVARAVVWQVGKPEEMKPRKALEGEFSQASLDKVSPWDPRKTVCKGRKRRAFRGSAG